MRVRAVERHFVSYPKSGRTWIRYIFAQLNVDQYIEFHHDNFEFNDGAKPPHDFDIARRIARYSQVQKLVYLKRDPRDIVVSLYSQITGRFKDFFCYTGSISEFIRDDYFGAENLKRFRDMWSRIVEQRDFMVMSYEAFHQDTEARVREMLDYYELQVKPNDIAKAVAGATFEQMKRTENAGESPHPWLRLRHGSPKVRRGKIGGFRDELCEEDIIYLSSVFGVPSVQGQVEIQRL
jgi:hypothetical protein